MGNGTRKKNVKTGNGMRKDVTDGKLWDSLHS
jgi:hypothetical protein